MSRVLALKKILRLRVIDHSYDDSGVASRPEGRFENIIITQLTSDIAREIRSQLTGSVVANTRSGIVYKLTLRRRSLEQR